MNEASFSRNIDSEGINDELQFLSFLTFYFLVPEKIRSPKIYRQSRRVALVLGKTVNLIFHLLSVRRIA